MIRENGGWEMFKMIEIEKYPCVDTREAERRECVIMKELKATMNTNYSFTTSEERIIQKKIYSDKHKEEMKEYGKEYREKNK